MGSWRESNRRDRFRWHRSPSDVDLIRQFVGSVCPLLPQFFTFYPFTINLGLRLPPPSISYRPIVKWSNRQILGCSRWWRLLSAFDRWGNESLLHWSSLSTWLRMDSRRESNRRDRFRWQRSPSDVDLIRQFVGAVFPLLPLFYFFTLLLYLGLRLPPPSISYRPIVKWSKRQILGCSRWGRLLSAFDRWGNESLLHWYSLSTWARAAPLRCMQTGGSLANAACRANQLIAQGNTPKAEWFYLNPALGWTR